jgi:hypothetical protein
MSDALEAARRTLRDHNPRDALSDDVVMARYILSLAQRREETIEECAKVADAAKSESDRLYQSHLERGNYDSMDRCAARAGEARAISERIRLLNSLPSKEGGVKS